MSARDDEAAMLSRCAVAARDRQVMACDGKEANVFRLAAMVVQSRFSSESANLMQASERYFTQHPGAKLAAVDVVRNGWVLSLPRLRDMLSRHAGTQKTMKAEPVFQTQTALAQGLRRLLQQLDLRATDNTMHIKWICKSARHSLGGFHSRSSGGFAA